MLLPRGLYTLRLPFYLVYMLQQVEYNPQKFLTWIKELSATKKSIASVMSRKQLVMTGKAKLLLLFAYGLALGLLLLDIVLFIDFIWLMVFNLLIALICLPGFLIIGLSIVSFVAYRLIVLPRQSKQISASKKIFTNHSGVIIAVIGSYGKTTMKEMLDTVLSEGLVVAKTPGNMNTAYSQARFAQTLTGKEDVIIVEFGEGAPGDVARMSATVQPSYAVVTGLAPNHLDYYSSIDEVASDLLSVQEHVDSDNIYITEESAMLQKYVKKDSQKFSRNEVMGWKISNVLVSVTQTAFTMKKGKKTLTIKAGLLGRHQVAPVAFGAALSDAMGLSKTQIESGCSHIAPFEHRMQPRHVSGAWIIDDTYNGNLEGLQAGLKLLDELDFKRKWYVTPGLVDQGFETEHVHIELGKAIAETDTDIVVLMENSARPIIEKSMKKHGFKGELRIEKNPLDFYLNIEHMIAAGDIVLMQNDWTDNYN